jgi:hypothetical protein
VWFAQSLLQLGVSKGVPVLPAVSAFPNEQVARRSDFRATSEEIVRRVGFLAPPSRGSVRTTAPVV